MRAINTLVERYRVKTGKLASDASWGNNGWFQVPYSGERLNVIVSDEDGWDHISVSLPTRCPTWDEMQYIRSLWFRDEEWVVQYSPPKSAHINAHPYCLHLWRFQISSDPASDEWLPTPPSWMIA